MHLFILQLVSLRQSSSQVDHGLYWHSSLNPLVAPVELGVCLLYESHPEFVRIRAASVAVVIVFLWQSAHVTLPLTRPRLLSPVVNVDRDPAPVPPQVDPHQARVAGAVEDLQ